MNNRKGFTLIELLVVISVISILVGIVIPRFKGMQNEANAAKARAELKTLQTGVESYFMHREVRSYPESTTALCADVLNSASPSIVASPLYDPFAATGTEYNYILSPLQAYYVIVSVGDNGTADITGIDDDGVLTGANVDDIYVTNGTGWS